MLKRMALALPLALVMSFAPGLVRAGPATSTTSCVGGYDAFSCTTIWGQAGDPYIRTLPGPVSAQGQAELMERDRKWVARCHPVIRQDRYGVSHYQYAAPGCEFGVIEAGVDAAGW